MRNGYNINPIALTHLAKVFHVSWVVSYFCCDTCNRLVPVGSKFCPFCGKHIYDAVNYSKWVNSVVDSCVEARAMLGEHHSFRFPKEGVYVIYCEDSADPVSSPYRYKIGLSDDIERRINTFSTANPHRLELLHVIQTSDLNWAEQWIHQRLAKYRIRFEREWFRLGLTELKWLFSFDRIDPPRTFINQHTILDLLESFPDGKYHE